MDKKKVGFATMSNAISKKLKSDFFNEGFKQLADDAGDNVV